MFTKRRTAVGLGLAIATLAALPATASARERCCFRVQTTVTGTVLTNYDAPPGPDGFRPRDSWHGRYDVTWSWTMRHLAEYRESDDSRRVPFLSVPEVCGRIRRRRCRSTAVKLRLAYKETSGLCQWERAQDTNNDGRPDVQVCNDALEYANCNKDWGFSSGGRFITLGSNVATSWAADFVQLSTGGRGLEVGHHVGATQLPGVTVDGRRCRSGGHGDHSPFTPTTDGNDFVFPREGGPFKYELALPPPSRADFRRRERFGTGLLPTRASHPFEDSLDQENRRHTMEATGNVKISFVWFPQRKLRREARRLDQLQ